MPSVHVTRVRTTLHVKGLESFRSRITKYMGGFTMRQRGKRPPLMPADWWYLRNVAGRTVGEFWGRTILRRR